MSSGDTLNRFPLFGLFAYRAARRVGHSDRKARLLGYSMAVLYAIFKSQAQRRREEKEHVEKKRKLPDEARGAKLDRVRFGGHQFLMITDDAHHARKSVVGNKIHEPDDYGPRVREKFPGRWHDKLLKQFDRYLASRSPSELEEDHTVYELYREWRDDCKTAGNRVDLEKLSRWLREHRDR